MILGVRVDATNYSDASARIVKWARERRSCYVCCAPVSSIMEARRSAEYAAVMAGSALVTPDGMPLVWLLRAMGVPRAVRVYGPDLMVAVLSSAAAEGIEIGFYGGTRQALAKLQDNCRRRFPALKIVYAESPPFRALARDEDERVRAAIENSGARILFVGLGSPKQDHWMFEHCSRLSAVMLGVGAAFDFLSGTKLQAPRWMQQSGLEWLFRLMTEPRRLWRRYLFQNPSFAVLAIAQLIRMRLHEHRR
jgi:N-acetylglucosaminyldiphosphoundecaprenol N-acetyl-beta-D-mannosaminyltransferase